MLQPSRGLTPDALAAIADLEARVVAVDGGRLKLEYGVLTSRPPEQVNDLLWWVEDRLIGFLGMYGFGAPTLEIAGMVDPAVRRQGIGSALLDAALPLALEREYGDILLVTPRNDGGGALFAGARGAELEHSEHALVLDGDPVDGPADPSITTRAAGPGDVVELGRILAAAFDLGPTGVAERMARDHTETIMIEQAGRTVGTLRATLHGELGGIYGFAVDPRWQGRGIGRDVLRRTCRTLRERGARQVALEVAVDNEHALGLYTSLGFTRVLTEDYYALPPGGTSG